jgi:23S rRNA pseudouridine1911/1915/1917 synthase
MTQRLHVKVPEQFSNSRLDQALAQLLPDHSRSFLARCIEEGRVSVDGTVAQKRSQMLLAGAHVEVEVPSPSSSGVESQDLPIEILYQDDSLAVINKAAGMVVHPSAGHSDATLVNALLFHIPDLSGIGGEVRPGIVHRLDKDTSGVMVIAKNDAAHRKLTGNWNSDLVQKEYLALVYGKPKESHGRIEAPIGRDPRDRKKMAVVDSGRAAVTLYRTIEEFRHVALVRCSLKSGRTHQIRVHLKSIGHPIVGDPVYSGPQWRGIPDKKLQRLLASVKRQALHAARLRFPHPVTGEVMTFEAPLPEDMEGVLRELRSP